MELEVKLYYYHDLDLIGIYRQGSLWFQKATVIALKSFCEKNYIRMKSSKPCRELNLRRVYRYRVYLSEEKDAEVISLLGRIQPGHRNNFIKTILRQYFCEFPAEYFKDPADKAYFDQCTASMHDVVPITCAMPNKKSGNYRNKKTETLDKKQGKDQMAASKLTNKEGMPDTTKKRIQGDDTPKDIPTGNPMGSVSQQEGLSSDDELTMLFMDLTR